MKMFSSPYYYLISLVFFVSLCLCSELSYGDDKKINGGEELISHSLNQLAIRSSSPKSNDANGEETMVVRINEFVICKSKQPYVPNILFHKDLQRGCQTLVLDLDDCLYPKSSSFQQQHLVPAITDYLAFHLGNGDDTNVSSLGYQSYLEKGHSVYAINKELERRGEELCSLDDYETFINSWLEEKSSYSLIKKDTELRKMLLSFKGNVIVFTNSCQKHCHRSLIQLGIMDCIDSVVCVDIMHPEFKCKPHPSTYSAIETLLSQKGCTDGLIFADDSPANIKASVERGWKSVLIHEELEAITRVDDGHHHAPLVHCLEEIYEEHF